MDKSLKHQNISVLDRIRGTKKKNEYAGAVEFKSPATIKKELSDFIGKAKKERPSHLNLSSSKLGRPRLAAHLKSQNIRISLKSHLFKLIEERKLKSKSRSSAICELMDKGLLYEELKSKQAKSLKSELKHFNELLSQLEIDSTSNQGWRKSRVSMERNEKMLNALYKKSLEIKKMIEVSSINSENLSEMSPFLNAKELKYLEFASSPERIANIVS